MVDVIGAADAVCKAVKIVDRSKDIIDDDVLGNKLGCLAFKQSKLFLLAQTLKGGEDVHENGIANIFVDADIAQLFLCELGKIGLYIHHLVRDDLDGLVASFNKDISHLCSGLNNLICTFLGNQLALFGNDFAGLFVNNGSCKLQTADTVKERKLFVVFIAADS